MFLFESNFKQKSRFANPTYKALATENIFCSLIGERKCWSIAKINLLQTEIVKTSFVFFVNCLNILSYTFLVFFEVISIYTSQFSPMEMMKTIVDKYILLLRLSWKLMNCKSWWLNRLTFYESGFKSSLIWSHWHKYISNVLADESLEAPLLQQVIDVSLFLYIAFETRIHIFRLWLTVVILFGGETQGQFHGIV